jgi:hypothetical protein
MKITLEPKELERDPNLFDWALRTARSPGDQIVVLPGATALTRGSWAFPEFGWIGLADRVSLNLTGSILRLSPGAVLQTDGVERPSKDINLLWIGDGSSIKGGVLDANYHEFPGWSCGGVRAFGRCTLEKLTIMGLSGSRGLQESFAFSAQGATGGTIISEVAVEKCKVDDADSYVSGIYVGATEDNGEESTVKNCNVYLGPRGQFAYSSTFDTLFINCYGDAMRFWYTDTGPGIARIESCKGVVSYSVIGSVATPYDLDVVLAKVSRVNRQIIVANSSFSALDLATAEKMFGPSLNIGARWVEWWNKSAEGIGAVVIVNSTLTGFRWRSAVAAETGAVIYLNCSGVTTDGDTATPGSFQPISGEIKL